MSSLSEVKVFSGITSRIVTKANQAYTTPIEHHTDLMTRQELLVHRVLIHNRRKFNQKQEPFIPGFFAVSNEEIDALLGFNDTKEIKGEYQEKEKSIQKLIVSIDNHIAERVAFSIQSGLRRFYGFLQDDRLLQ